MATIDIRNVEVAVDSSVFAEKDDNLAFVLTMGANRVVRIESNDKFLAIDGCDITNLIKALNQAYKLGWNV
jgi:electron transfer flavoprotein alpha/beta subunit